MKAKQTKKTKLALIITLVAVNVFFLLALIGFSILNKSDVSRVEAQNVASMDYDRAKDYLVSMAKKKGGVYAYHFLLTNKFKPGVDLHLLGHAVGEQLYIQKGIDGMADCTPDLQNACSHAIIVGYFNTHGENQLDKIKEACKHAPGGPSAYIQCFHGLGHGVLSYKNYDLKKAIEICNKFGGKKGEDYNCAGGAVMEIVDGGFHDPELWREKRKKYIVASDPLSPCDTDIVPADKKPICYIFLTPALS